jgi:hypothetical protein
MSTQRTPFEGIYGHEPVLPSLKTFGSWVCVERTGHHHSKLDHHDFSRIFIGYTASDHNIAYINLDLGLLKTSHHAQFNEAWYLQPSCPPAAQLLYDLGLEADDDVEPDPDPHPAPYPPIASQKVSNNSWKTPPGCCHLPLPLQCTTAPRLVAASATCMVAESPEIAPRCLRTMISSSAIANEYRIGHEAMEMIYIPDPYHESFDELLDSHRFDISRHATAGLSLEHNGKVLLANMAPETPGAKIP